MPVTAALSGLTPGTTYYVRVVATSAVGTTPGVILSFTTPAPPPVVTLVSARWMTARFVVGKRTKKVKAARPDLQRTRSTPSRPKTLRYHRLLSGKVKKKVVTYKKRVPLSLALYNVGTQTVSLLPKNAKKLTKRMQLRVTAALLSDTLNRPVDAGHDIVVTINKSAFTIGS